MTGRWVRVLLPVVTTAAVLAAWWFGSLGTESYYFPSLRDIMDRFVEVWLFDRFVTDAVPSLWRLGAGFGIAVVAGVGLGLLLGLSASWRRATEPIVEFLRAIPATALLPFALLVFGIGDLMKVAIIALVCLWPVLLNTIDGVRGLDHTLADTARMYQVSGARRLLSVVLPSAAPQIMAGARTSLSLALILMVTSEMVASTSGIGFFVLDAQRGFRILDMWTGIILLGVLGYLVNLVFTLVERRLLRWHAGARADTASAR
ncbi:ABC transporter permease [Actinoalloteichus sp. AHMU CJ021]|uniref:ABC-type nitrate/sulfonate/bicarbonate transport system, permease component n=1 Tax=Actinoalloteichus caeruleus DSM 43889 TaxID=1120930 RepID=A0ABT1JHI8_ACTCY|nr:ABC transporter permease [Actinoalloteichus caeruleus]AUS77712.1 ABC transporter permease [Actinoalloteichus sp. AHMU CJ021]MCP2331636.1 ABC-type nitrate/sulfonate/bicarbonate transport system, permease component [Actinoalloteichus caeruleus DSM 43889]